MLRSRGQGGSLSTKISGLLLLRARGKSFEEIKTWFCAKFHVVSDGRRFFRPRF